MMIHPNELSNDPTSAYYTGRVFFAGDIACFLPGLLSTI